MTTLTAPGMHTRPVLQFNHVASTAEEKPAVIVDASETLAPKPTTTLKTALGDQCNLRTLADKLQGIIQDLPRQLAPAPSLSMAKAREQLQTALATQLKSTLMYVCEDSSHPSQPPLPANRLISLEAFLLGCGMPVPKTLEALVELRNEMAWQAQVHPLGDLGGGLSWPSPMPAQHQNRLVALLQSNTSGLPGLPLADGAKGALGYLLSGSSVSEADLKKPLAAIEKLLDSAKAQALGQAMLSQLGGSPPGSGGNDYVLAAIHLGLDPESLAAPARNSVAGFDLAQSGQRASVVIDGLARHLVAKGRTSAQTASLGAYLLLARTAPQFLVKDIPPSVTYGSVLWAQLAMAVGKIEAQAPGRTLGMGYAEILLTAEKLPSDEVSEQIEYQALKDWDAARKFETTAAQTPSSDDMERARTAFNEHLNSLKTTSVLLQTPIPSRKADGLAQLKAAFPGIDPKLFEVRNIQQARLREGRPGLHPGMRSMLDIVMEGVKLGPEDHWISTDKRLPIDKFCALYEVGKLGVATAFKTAYDSAINAHQQGHQNVVRHLISTLPLEDRKNLEFGELEFFHTNQYKIAGDLFTPPALHVRGNTLEVKTTRDGQVNIYLIDTRRGTIEKQNFLTRRRSEPYTDSKMESREANILTKTVRFAADQIIPEGSTQSDSFNSRRSHFIADVFVKSLDLKNDDLLREARDVTSYDQDSARNEAIGEFFLNLIPLRSAIVNFQNGNIGQGIFDLAVDAVGLLTLGVGKAGQAGKVASKALSSMSHLAKAARFVGATAVEAFNPLSGAGDLLVGGGRLLKAAGRRLKHLPTVPEGELGNRLFREFKVPESTIAGLSRNNQGVYVAADGHRSHIRHTDSTGQSAVYEVRQVTRTVDGKVQARVYHNNRQTGLQLEHVQGDQWRRLGLKGGHPTSIKEDLGPVIGQGGEAIVYSSLDGKRAYKDYGPTSIDPENIPNSSEVIAFNRFYGEGFARVAVENGRKYLVMNRIEGVSLGHFEKGSLPSEARSLMAETMAELEAKNVYHNDMQLKNYIYSAKDKKIYPVDLDALPRELMPSFLMDDWQRGKQKLLREYAQLIAKVP
ncbi:hypothetical protein SAMN04490190_2398 [Pseudomonas libanensis]|uniref:Kinase OspG kinase domain-containing protein n=1 Tax=Pseudomonas libanensis TaxID=75588 RepID=A0A0R2YC47_9PSED|nr:hypothetical protein [Pseudomonas libanensis]KRP43828.1 hypothetical protein TU73_17715 [Pseudomonas libanensis]SDK93245.1 hypothetical protein SAMN04490190_2398 [Pseudomonas libanensis]